MRPRKTRVFTRWMPGLLALAIAAGLGAGPADSQPADDATCLTCHTSPDIARSDPRRGGSVRVDEKGLRASAHGGLACSRCHAGASGIPHAERLPEVRCASCHGEPAAALGGSVHSPAGAGQTACTGCHGAPHAVRRVATGDGEACAPCHADVVARYRASVHGAGRAHGDGEAAACRDCHGSIHTMLPHTDPRSRTSRDSLATTCARCHADRELTMRRKITIPAAVALYQKSVHGRSQRPGAATCNDCHESHDLRRATDPASSINKANIPTTCGRCHKRESEDFAVSVHGTARARGVTASPVCTDCHGEHLIRGPRDTDSPVAAGGVTATCAHCHESIGIRETYGLPAGRLSTYQDSFHGLAARGGSPVAANCASCHGYHRILPSDDPASATNAANLPTTCGACHPGAGERFARGAVHVAMARPDQPILGMVRFAYLWLIALTIGGMVLHNLLDFVYKLRRRLRSQWGKATIQAAAVHAAVSDAMATGGAWFVRMTSAERLQHAALAVSFFVLVYTGFALKFPEAWPFAWLARLEGGYAWRSLIHRGAALVMVAVSLYHMGYLFTPRGRQLVRDLLPGPGDAAHLMQNLLYWLGLRRTPPAFDRFGYIEKAEYWALIWGTGVMTITGVALWFENQSLQYFDKWVLDLATMVHYYEAWLAFLAIVVWHLYQNIVNPDVYPMNWTWLTGTISEEQLRHEHGAEWERWSRANEPEEAAEDTPAGPAPGTATGPPAPGAADEAAPA